MDKLLFKRIIIGLLALLVVAYIVYLFANAHFGNGVETEEARYITSSDVVYSTAYIIRDEEYLTNDSDGVLSFNVKDGDKISVGQNIADVYETDSDAVYRQQIAKIDEQIKKLTTLSESYYKNSISLETADGQISNSLYSISADVQKGDIMSAKTYADTLLQTICERQLITGEAKSFSSKITQLKEQKSKLESECSDTIGSLSSDNAGYFATYTDGLEKYFKYNSLDKITASKLNKAKAKKVPKNVIGKVVKNPVWYIACEISYDNVISLSKIKSVDGAIFVSMPSVTNVKIPASIYSINQSDTSDNSVLILSCDYMDSNIADARVEDIEIDTTEYSGLKVSKRALHEDYVERTVTEKDGTERTEKKRVMGVYVLHGSELVFKQISIVFSSTDYVLCDPHPEDKVLFNGRTVELYDKVVIKGDNLYDGKVIT